MKQSLLIEGNLLAGHSGTGCIFVNTGHTFFHEGYLENLPIMVKKHPLETSGFPKELIRESVGNKTIIFLLFIKSKCNLNVNTI